ncbi:signal transduction histidine kinase [Idiomarina fontislapidosi]|uniref:sensor histidine kinase n=1 Tax=Idiomarina fontislapidosi TaxID=263723 RepID=UPI000D9B0F1C|nr:HAMP domain-containing sensor histidine kinase [Idiomarina fontislapidosi]PYE35192.1 signal transduction histidine kinase [Idiomarina fontislapidosi]
MSNARPSLIRRFSLLLFTISVLFITLLFGMTYVAQEQMESISLRYWLDTEAHMYEQQYRRFGEQGQQPNPYQFDIYWSRSGTPLWLSSYVEPGHYEHQLGPEDKHFKVSPAPSGEGLYYLVFKDDADDFLDDYETRLHALSFTLALLISVLLTGLMFYLYRQFTTPLKKVVDKVALLAPNQPTLVADAHYRELYNIEQALLEGQKQIQQYLAREQDFTRFAAHEIRTPLMTLQGSSELLEHLHQADTSPMASKALARIKGASEDIDQLIKTFLLLGQASLTPDHYQSVDVNARVSYQLSQLEPLRHAQAIRVDLEQQASPTVQAPPSFVDVLLKNVLKNAFDYADSQVQVVIGHDELRVINDVDHDAHHERRGFGYGLIIIERICEQLGWRYHINEWVDNQQQRQFSAAINFGNAPYPDTSPDPLESTHP